MPVRGGDSCSGLGSQTESSTDCNATLKQSATWREAHARHVPPICCPTSDPHNTTDKVRYEVCGAPCRVQPPHFQKPSIITPHSAPSHRFFASFPSVSAAFSKADPGVIPIPNPTLWTGTAQAGVESQKCHATPGSPLNKPSQWLGGFLGPGCSNSSKHHVSFASRGGQQGSGSSAQAVVTTSCMTA